MPRVAVCLLFITIFHNGIQKSSQASITTTEDLTNNTVTQPTNVEVKASEAPSETATVKDSEISSKTELVQDSGVPSKEKSDERSGVPSKIEPFKDHSDVPQNITDKTEEVDVKPNESKKKDVTEKAKSGDTSTEKSSTSSKQQSNLNNKFPNNILGPVMEVGAKIEDVVSKGVNSAKNIANGAFTFLSSTVSNILN